MIRSILLATSAITAFTALPANAQTAEPTDHEQELRALIVKLNQTLREANEALAAEVRRKQPATPANPGPLLSATQLRTQAASRKPVPRPAEMPACDTAGSGGSIGEYMLRMHNADRQKKESSYDANEAGTNEGINAFVYHCLGLTRARDYESTTNLSGQFTASKGSDRIEAVLTRSARAIKAARKEGEPAIAATYNRYSLGGFGLTGSNGEAPLFDLTESSFASGVGVVAGFEWGRMPAKKLTAAHSGIHQGIAKARQECLAANVIVEPLTMENASNSDRPYLAIDPVAACEGNALTKWMSAPKRANKYWTEMIAPLWGYSAQPELFAGAQLRYAFQDVSYLPVIDPKTGNIVAATLPSAVEAHPEPYSVKLYGGFNRPIKHDGKDIATIGLTASLTYRGEVEFIDGTAGKTVCTPPVPGATFTVCKGDQKLAAPYDTSGFVGGIALNLQSIRFWYLPQIAISPRFTYAFDTNRPGIEVPVFLLTDSDGKLNSGVKFACRFRGETPEGFVLKKTCTANLFVGTSFELGKTP